MRLWCERRETGAGARSADRGSRGSRAARSLKLASGYRRQRIIGGNLEVSPPEVRSDENRCRNTREEQGLEVHRGETPRWWCDTKALLWLALLIADSSAFVPDVSRRSHLALYAKRRKEQARAKNKRRSVQCRPRRHRHRRPPPPPPVTFDAAIAPEAPAAPPPVAAPPIAFADGAPTPAAFAPAPPPVASRRRRGARRADDTRPPRRPSTRTSTDCGRASCLVRRRRAAVRQSAQGRART